MIISASRRTDLPAFYTDWFMNRIRAGFCTVPNPFNPQQISRISLSPEDVDVIVFWTRNPRPLLPHLAELDQRGYRYYFQYTLLDYPRPIETSTPPTAVAIENFQALAGQIGPERVIWRYDPILFSAQTGASFHLETYTRLAENLHGYTRRSVISVLTFYAKLQSRFEALAEQGLPVVNIQDRQGPRFAELMRSLVDVAAANQMQVYSCASELDLQSYGIQPVQVYADMLRKVRAAHPEAPLVCITPIFSTRELYDPRYVELSQHIRAVVAKAASGMIDAGDANVHLVDGLELLGPSDADCFQEGVHPTDLGFTRIADGLEPVLREALRLADR